MKHNVGRTERRSGRSMWWLVGAMALLGLGPLLVVAGTSVRVASDEARTQAHRDVGGAAAASAKAVSEQLSSIATLVESYAERPSVRTAMREPEGAARLGQALDDLSGAESQIESVFLTDASGNLKAISPDAPSIVGTSFSSRDWYQGVIATDDGYVSEVFKTETTGPGLVVAVAAPIHDPADDSILVGMIVAGYRLESIQEFVDNYSTAATVTITITDQRGVLVAETGLPALDLESRVDDVRIAAALRGEQGGGETTGTEDDRVYSYAPIPAIGWAVVARVPSNVAYASADSVRTRVNAVTVIIAVIVAAGLNMLVVQLRKRARSDIELRRSKELLDSIIENIPDMICVKDANLRFVRVNRASEELLGSARGELIGRTSIELQAQLPPGLSWPDDQATLDKGEPVDIPAETIETRDRGQRVLHTKKIPILAAEGTEPFLLWISQDITDRVTSEQQLRQAHQEADQANQSKNEFLSRMSHELRTPLNAVIGFAQLLDEGLLDPEQRDNARQILRGGQHLLGLINEVLDITLIETGRLRISLEPVRLPDVIDESLELVRPAAIARNIQFPYGHPRDCTLHVRADWQRLKQVLLNLLTNAVKYNRDHGTVEISCHTTAEGRVRIMVTDTGPGIPPDKLDLVFTPFERLGAENTLVEGNGLGLALAHRLIDQMGGDLGVDTTVGEGSTFWIELDPAHPLDTSVPITINDTLRQPHTPSTSEAKTLLYIEDNLSNIRLVERILASHPNYQLIIATHGQVGIELAQQHRPDLILLDLHLPDMNGDEILSRLRAEPATRTIPIIIISADATTQQSDRLLASGANGYLTKPIDIDEFRATISQHLDSFDTRSPAALERRGAHPGEHEPDLPTLDDNVVNSLAHLFVDHDDINEFLTTVPRDSSKRLDALQQAIDTADLDGIRRHAHSLKGTASTYGALRARQLSNQIEQQPDTEPAALRAIVAELRTSLQHAHQQLTIRLTSADQPAGDARQAEPIHDT